MTYIKTTTKIHWLEYTVLELPLSASKLTLRGEDTRPDGAGTQVNNKGVPEERRVVGDGPGLYVLAGEVLDRVRLEGPAPSLGLLTRAASHHDVVALLQE